MWKGGINMQTLIDRTLSVGLLHAGASELLIRRAMALHQQQGMKLRHEAKQAFTRFFEDYKRLQRSYERVQEIAYKDSKLSGDCYKAYVELVEKLKELFEKQQQKQ